MEALLLAAAQGLDAAGIGGWARGGPNVYPVANVAHVLGVIALVGAIGIVDLRLAGAWRELPLAALAEALTPVAVAGLVLLLASGTLLFAADGPALAKSQTFHVKLGLIALALVNAAAFRWRRAATGPVARVMALASLGLWLAIVVTGRMIAYS